MNKRHLYHTLALIRKIRPWYFVVLILISGIVSIAALRQNNLRALELRDTVLQVDKKNGDVETALHDLREYVYGHMNSKLSSPGGAYPPVQLKYRYERLLAAEKQRITTTNEKLYTEAQGYCEAQIPAGRSLYRIECIQNYITSRGAAIEQAIPDALYKFDFAPPYWSPDVAGWSLVVTAVLTLAFIFRSVAVFVIKQSLGHHQ